MKYKVAGYHKGQIVMHIRDAKGEIKLFATRATAQKQVAKFAAMTKTQKNKPSFKVLEVQALKLVA